LRTVSQVFQQQQPLYSWLRVGTVVQVEADFPVAEAAEAEGEVGKREVLKQQTVLKLHNL
jgi:hypothetical protein